MNGEQTGPVLVQVVGVEDGREIGWRKNLAEQLEDRSDDIHQAIAAGTKVVADGLDRLQAIQGWRLGEVSASFGVTLATEAGVIL